MPSHYNTHKTSDFLMRQALTASPDNLAAIVGGHAASLVVTSIDATGDPVLALASFDAVLNIFDEAIEEDERAETLFD